MSVASKTTTKLCTLVAFGSMMALSALPTWANTSPEISLSTMGNAYMAVSASGTQDISVLWEKLKERFSGLSQEVVSLVKGTTPVSQSFHASADVREIDVREGISAYVPVSSLTYTDIDGDPYVVYIKRLAAYGVLSPSQKFYPQNYFRTDDFSGLLAKLYQKKFGQSLELSSIEGLVSSDGCMTKWMLQQVMMSLGIATIVVDGNPYDKLIRSEGTYYLVRMFDLPILDAVETPVVAQLPDYFVDIVGHPFAQAINTLANLGIVSVQQTKFYPDNYLRHYDFVVMLVSSVLYAADASLPTQLHSSFADVPAAASYAPYFAYAADRGLIDALITSRGGQLYADPNVYISKHEAYMMLSKILNVQFTYDTAEAEQLMMTRGEMAQLLVTGFGFMPKTISSESDSSEDIDDDALLQKLKVLLSLI